VSRVRAIMAVSADGYVCRGPDDDMRWTGPEDKSLFRSVTDGSHIGAGTTTWRAMRGLKLPNRTLVRITRWPDGELEETLGDFARNHPNGWLIGGQTMLLAAIRADLVERVLLSHVRAELGGGEADRVSSLCAWLDWSPIVSPRPGLQIVAWRRGA
jgi:dihydrofolate reductase